MPARPPTRGGIAISIRATCQRNAIVEVIRNAPGPLRATEILELASRIVPTLGIATVYRQLKHLQESGEARAVVLGSHDVRYEPADLPHHHHFACDSCDRVFDVMGCSGHLEELVPQGFTVESHELLLHGRCRDCSSSAKES